jgi:hypothetical protein
LRHSEGLWDEPGNAVLFVPCFKAWHCHHRVHNQRIVDDVLGSARKEGVCDFRVARVQCRIEQGSCPSYVALIPQGTTPSRGLLCHR